MADAPTLTGESARAVEHRGSHMQIIAAAGSGKTEVVSQRVASLLAEDADPRSIVAFTFTFTERAAEEMRQRIEIRAAERIGPSALDKIGGLFVGTIHAYCFQLLQQHVPRYETCDVLDDNQLTAFLCREAKRLEICQLDPSGESAVRIDQGVPPQRRRRGERVARPLRHARSVRDSPRRLPRHPRALPPTQPGSTDSLTG